MGFQISYDVYIASPLFSDAERTFNAYIAAQLRNRSLSVFVPQELEANHSKSPTDDQIFSGDTTALLSSRLMLAVLDGETIDAGVATEIGIALANHVPVVGLWTDIRQHRVGSSRMYRNVYVLGAIRRNGLIATDTNDAVTQCLRILNGSMPGYLAERERTVAMFYARQNYQTPLRKFFLDAYAPAFDHNELLMHLISKHCNTENLTVIDWGCGSSTLNTALQSAFANVRYIGIDPAITDGPLYREEFNTFAPSDPCVADVVVLSFILHDYRDKIGLIDEIKQFMSPCGLLVLLDLEQSDLPVLANEFSKKLMRFPSSNIDSRLSPGSIQLLAAQAGFSQIDIGLTTTCVTFPNSDLLRTYVSGYGIDEGYDLNLFSHDPEETRRCIDILLGELKYPFQDYRSFIYAVLRRQT